MGRDDCYNFVSDCRIRLVTDLLSHSWDPIVLVALRIGPQRRSALIIAIGDVSDKALTESLRRLTARGLVTRTSESTVRNVEYALTAVGASLVHGPLASLGQWALDHGDELMEPVAV